jgi:hypothetical protein
MRIMGGIVLLVLLATQSVSMAFAQYTALAQRMAQAQSTDPNVCAVLANKITPDISSQSTVYDRFAIFQQLISDQRFQDYNTANSTNLDGGLTVVGYVDLFLGTQSDSKSWQTNWENFKKSTYYSAASTFNSSTFQSTWSSDVITAIANCNNFYGLVMAVTPDQRSFTIKLHGIGNWQLFGISPLDPALTCNGDERATPQQPINFVNDHLLQCQKDPNVTLLVSVHDSQQDVGPFTIYSVADNIQHQQDSLVKQLRSDIDSLRTQLNLSNLNTAAQIAQMSKNLLVWNKAATQIAPPQAPSGGGAVSCGDGYYVVGMDLVRTTYGLNGLQLVCHQLNAAAP